MVGDGPTKDAMSFYAPKCSLISHICWQSLFFSLPQLIGKSRPEPPVNKHVAGTVKTGGRIG